MTATVIHIQPIIARIPKFKGNLVIFSGGRGSTSSFDFSSGIDKTVAFRKEGTRDVCFLDGFLCKS